MSVRIKIAQTAKELDDVFHLRHQVYVKGEGVLKGMVSEESGTVFDRFDALPPVANIIAYSGDKAIGTMRINLDTGTGLPPDELHDFSEYRKQITEQWMLSHDTPPRFGSAGMLAIHSDWRNRRDVIRALLKLGAGIGSTWGGTHIIATPSAKTAAMYTKLGFETLDNVRWIEEIGDHIQAVAGTFENFYNWTFGNLIENRRFLDAFANRFQRLILGNGETLFQEGSEGHEAFIIDTGTIRISRASAVSDRDSTLAVLGRGDLFGELSLFDAKPRSAHATALTNSELVVLVREDFISGLKERGRMQYMLEFLAGRLRRANELIGALHGSDAQRMKHAFDDIQSSAVSDPKRPGVLLAKVGLIEFASNAGVTEQEARKYLDEQEASQQIEYTDRRIRFLNVESNTH